MRLKRVPETNSFGLVLPPTPDKLKYFQRQIPKPRPQSVDRHHLYWPNQLYKSSDLAHKFREHRFNSVWLLLSDHRKIHWRYDGVPIPPKDVMERYLEEATLLDEMNVCVTAIEMIDSAIYEDRVKWADRTEDRRSRHLSVVQQGIERAERFEVVPSEVAELIVSQAVSLTLAA